jgi:hypothetical protein
MHACVLNSSFSEYLNRLVATLISNEEHPLVPDWSVKVGCPLQSMIHRVDDK